MEQYIDKHGRDIRAGDCIRCTLDGEVEVVYEHAEGLSIKGNSLDDGKTSYHPLTSFAFQTTPDGRCQLEDFEIVT